jgi:hypothetical protein
MSELLEKSMKFIICVLVALLLAPPAVGLKELDDATKDPVQIAQIAAEPCEASDESGGFGGQAVECPFACDINSFISLSVTATDEDADVSGDAVCADIAIDCGNGTHHCDTTSVDVTSSPGGGTCKGSSAEAIDSGLRINCSSSAKPGPGTVPDCILTEPIKVCKGDMAAASAHIWFENGVAKGTRCRSATCVAVVPACITIEGRITCAVVF